MTSPNIATNSLRLDNAIFPIIPFPELNITYYKNKRYTTGQILRINLSTAVENINKIASEKLTELLENQLTLKSNLKFNFLAKDFLILSIQMETQSTPDANPVLASTTPNAKKPPNLKAALVNAKPLIDSSEACKLLLASIIQIANSPDKIVDCKKIIEKASTISSIIKPFIEKETSLSQSLTKVVSRLEELKKGIGFDLPFDTARSNVDFYYKKIVNTTSKVHQSEISQTAFLGIEISDGCLTESSQTSEEVLIKGGTSTLTFPEARKVVFISIVKIVNFIDYEIADKEEKKTIIETALKVSETLNKSFPNKSELQINNDAALDRLHKLKKALLSEDN